jgi:hypothetical protein
MYVYLFLLITSWFERLGQLNVYCVNDTRFLALSLFVCMCFFFVSFTRACL